MSLAIFFSFYGKISGADLTHASQICPCLELSILNCYPSSRQLKKYKIFLPVEIYLLAVFIVAPLAAYTPSARPVSTETTGFLYVFMINSFNALVYYILSNHIMEKCIEIKKKPYKVNDNSPKQGVE